MDCYPRRSWSKSVLRLISQAAVAGALGIAGPFALQAQSFTTDDPVIHRMWEVGMENSRTEALAQVLSPARRIGWSRPIQDGAFWRARSSTEPTPAGRKESSTWT
jgi:hypothetical protein